MDQAPAPVPHAATRWTRTRKRAFTGAMLAALLVLFVIEHQAFLETVRDANIALADAIKPITPGGIAAQVHARRTACTYRWLVVCEPKVETRPEGFSRIDDTGLGYDYDSSYFAAAWRTLGEVAQLPDAAWSVLATSWQNGATALAMTLLFLAVNVLVAMRVPLAAWPLALPLIGLVWSGLFWLVKELLLAASNGFGLVVEGLLCLLLVPSALLWLFEWLRTGHEIQAIAHKAAELKASLIPPK